MLLHSRSGACPAVVVVPPLSHSQRLLPVAHSPTLSPPWLERHRTCECPVARACRWAFTAVNTAPRWLSAVVHTAAGLHPRPSPLVGAESGASPRLQLHQTRGTRDGADGSRPACYADCVRHERGVRTAWSGGVELPHIHTLRTSCVLRLAPSRVDISSHLIRLTSVRKRTRFGSALSPKVVCSACQWVVDFRNVLSYLSCGTASRTRCRR